MEQDDLGLSPLPDSHPDWAAERDSDPNFEALSAEIARMSSMTESASAPPDWGLIVKNAETVLSAKAKDIQVAAYGAVGLFETAGLAGFSRGVKILGDILDAHSDDAYPPKKRKRARVNAIQWWLERAEAWLEGVADQEMEQEFADALSERIAKLNETLLANFEDEAPMLSALEAGVNRIPVKSPPPPEPESDDTAEIIAVETVPRTASSASSSGSSAPSRQAGAIQSPDDARKIIGACLTDARDAGEALASASTADSLPYRIRRWSAWALIKAAPPAEDGRTMLPPPESHLIQGLQSLVEAGDFAGALKLAEEQVATYLFWLDPHRVAAAALAAMGPSHQAAQTAVVEEVRSLVGRLPALPRLAFTDGTPFADMRTKAWLASLSESGGGGAETSPAVAEALEKARGLAAVNPEDALAALEQAGRGAGHPRDALLVRIEILKTFAGSGRAEGAKAQIPALVAALDRHGLDEWDPDLAAQALSAALGCLSEEADAGLVGELRQRLARTAPAQYCRTL